MYVYIYIYMYIYICFCSPEQWLTNKLINSHEDRSHVSAEVWSRLSRFTAEDFDELKRQQPGAEIFAGTIGPGQAIYLPMGYICAEDVGKLPVNGVSKRFVVKEDGFGLQWYKDTNKKTKKTSTRTRRDTHTHTHTHTHTTQKKGLHRRGGVAAGGPAWHQRHERVVR